MKPIVDKEDEELASAATWSSTHEHWRMRRKPYSGRLLSHVIADRVLLDRSRDVRLRDGNPHNLRRANLIIDHSMQSLVMLSPEDEDLRTSLVKLGGYAGVSRLGKTVLAHRVIASRMGLHIDRLEVDHKNHQRLDNRRENLRVANRLENMRNQKLSLVNTSGFKGVTWVERLGRYRSRIAFQSKRVHLGYFKCQIEAAKAYDAAATQLYGEFAALNFP